MLVKSMGRKHQLFLILDKESFYVTYSKKRHMEKQHLGRLEKPPYQLGEQGNTETLHDCLNCDAHNHLE